MNYAWRNLTGLFPSFIHNVDGRLGRRILLKCDCHPTTKCEKLPESCYKDRTFTDFDKLDD